MGRKRSFSRGRGLEAVRQQIEHWRQTRAKLSPMPEPLWGAAVRLVESHGVRATAQGLGICYKSLRKRVDATPARDSVGKAVSSQFVEFYPVARSASAPSATGLSDSIVVELCGSAGQRLTLRLSSSEQLGAAAALVGECWSHLT